MKKALRLEIDNDYMNMSSEELDAHPDVIDAKDKIEKVSGGYSYSSMGTPRLNVFGTNPELFDLNFSPVVFRKLRKDTLVRKKANMKDCLIPALDNLLMLAYGATLQSTDKFDDFFYKYNGERWLNGITIKSEGELLEKIANDKIPKAVLNSLPEDTREHINRVKTGVQGNDMKLTAPSPINLIYLSGGNNYNDFIQSSPDCSRSLSAAIIRSKTLESSMLKSIERQRRILVPTDRELVQYTKKNRFKPEPIMIIEAYETWFPRLIGTGEDMYDRMEEYPPSSMDDLPRGLGNKLDERFLDTAPVDDSGAIFVVNDENSLVFLSGIINSILSERFRQPSYKNENFSKNSKEVKDRSSTWVITSSRDALCSELRLKTLNDALVSQFGTGNPKLDEIVVKPEYGYKEGILSGINSALLRRDKKVQYGLEKFVNIIYNCEKFYNLRASDIGIKLP